MDIPVILSNKGKIVAKFDDRALIHLWVERFTGRSYFIVAYSKTIEVEFCREPPWREVSRNNELHLYPFAQQ
jgi:hypothetical protein